MTHNTTIERLRQLPRSDRRAGLEAFIGAKFKRALLMSDDDNLPFEENYFDLGLTSLKAAELKQHFEDELDCELDTSIMFSSSTVRQVVDYCLADDVLLDVVPPTAASMQGKHRLNSGST